MQKADVIVLVPCLLFVGTSTLEEVALGSRYLCCDTSVQWEEPQSRLRRAG